MPTELLLVMTAFGAIIALGLLFYFVPIGLWVQAWTSGAPVGIGTLIAMRLRKVPPAAIIAPRIAATRSGIQLSMAQLEGHFLAGGNVALVVRALISADKADIALTFARAAAIDLAGRNVLEAVQMSVLPKVITTPQITAMAKDGERLRQDHCPREPRPIGGRRYGGDHPRTRRRRSRDNYRLF
jgi:uncharacterized protein YqfA (UPF0365 family)